MAKKDFSQINANPVYNSIAESTMEEKKRRARKTYTEEEIEDIQNSLQTAGRKGAKLPRINMAFTRQNYDYINTMAKASGLNLTEFVNKVMDAHREGHTELYNRALEFRNSI